MSGIVADKKALLDSFHAAQIQADEAGCAPLVLNHAAAAGYLLHQHRGSVRAALAACPIEFPWWDTARRYLIALRGQEAAA